MSDDTRRAALDAGLQELERREGQAFPLTALVEQALQGAVYPLGGRQLVQVARENEAPPTILTLLSALPERAFASLDDVARAVDGH